MKKLPAAAALLITVALSVGCQTCHDYAFCSDMMGHSTQEVMAWLGTPTGFKCEYGVDEYTWCGQSEAREHSRRVSPVPVRDFTDENGVRHVHYKCIAPPPGLHRDDDPGLTFRFYDNRACGFYIMRADKVCNRFVPEHFHEAYTELHKQKGNGH